MALRPFAVLVEDAASGESQQFLVEASSALIACTRAATRLLGPDAETRPVYGCAVCGAELWDAEGRDSSGFRFCEDCSPDDLDSREEQEPIGLAAGAARVSAIELAALPGDAPAGALRVVVGDPRGAVEPGEVFEDDEEARAAIERALAAGPAPLEDLLGELTMRDDAGAYFRYGVRPAAAPVDAHDLAARGLIEPEEEEEEEGEDEEESD